VGVRAALSRALREAVRSGRLAPGTPLPSSRSLSADLGLARNTVVGAYTELVAEGWLTARQGSGTRVAPRAESRSPSPAPSRRPGVPSRSAPRPVRHLFPGSPDAASFPRTAWLAAARRAVTAAPGEAFGYGDARGRPELRRALAGYLARARGVFADPERIVVCSGFVHGLRLLAAVLRERGTQAMAVEAYGLDVHRDIITAAGIRTTPLTVDEHGARIGDLAGRTGVRTVLLTPAHQFPTGVPLHPRRRAAVVDWAYRTGGVVIEDDYDGEFRYDRRQVGALQGLAPERVVYAGTASKSLSPGLRLGWMVLPEDLVEPVLAAKGRVEWQAGVLDQLTLAEFIDSGAYDRHVRAMRQCYRRRRDQLVAALADRAPHIRVSGIAAGLHAVLQLPPGTEETVVGGAVRHGLALAGLGRFRYGADCARDCGGGDGGGMAPMDRGEWSGGVGGGAGPVSDGLVVGYGTPPEHAFTGAIDALCRALP
jgi:GntR family transcriptional regulator/MocR family aminotransferase